MLFIHVQAAPAAPIGIIRTKRCGCCMQTMAVPFTSRDAAQLLGTAGSSAGRRHADGSARDDSARDDSSLARDCHSVEAGVVQGFQLASAAGPLCDEPMWGLTFQVQPWVEPTAVTIVASTSAWAAGSRQQRVVQPAWAAVGLLAGVDVQGPTSPMKV